MALKDQIVEFLLRPSRHTQELATLPFYLLIFSTPLLLGSLGSIYFLIGMGWPLVRLMAGTTNTPVPKPVLWVAVAFATFFCVEAFSSLALGGPEAWSEIIENIPFLGIIPIWWVSIAPGRRILDDTSLVAAGVAIAGLLIILLAMTVGDLARRPELMTGNASVMAVTAAVALTVTLCGALIAQSPGRRNFLLAGATAAAMLVLLSGTRSVWPSVILVPVILWIAMRPRIPRPSGTVLALVVALVAVAAALTWDTIGKRVETTQRDIEKILSGEEPSKAVNLRLQMWDAALEIVHEHPWTGVGPGNFKQAMFDRTEALSGTGFAYTHTHNAVLNALVRAGIPGLIAFLGLFVVPLLLIILYRERARGERRIYAAFLVSIQAVFALSGVAGLTIGHDILDVVFISSTVFFLHGFLR